MTTPIRRIEAGDEPRWRELWDGYTRFYEREPREALTRRTWARIMDPGSPIDAIVAEHRGRVMGIANYLTHESTLAVMPVCYLQDLFVDPACRGAGLGRAMIDWLVAEMKARGWARLYWNTRADNAQARALYDRYTPESGFVRYVLHNAEANA
jgi:GNAT superfamily N-acetyltransferase